MRLRVHHPLFAGFVGFIGLLVVLIVAFTGTGLRGQLDDIYQRELEHQLDLAHALVEASPSKRADALANLISARIDSRVTFIGPGGTVIADSSVEPRSLPDVESHLDRPEVQGVLGGAAMSFAQRTSATVGESFLYGARMSTLAGQPVVLRIATPRTGVETAVEGMQRTVAVMGLLIMILASGAAFVLSKLFTRPLVALADEAGRLGRGDFTTKVPLGRVAELQDLAAAFNRLTDEIQARLSDLGRERDEMTTLIDCMAEGVIALTDDGRVSRVNRSARAMLGIGRVPELANLTSVIFDDALRASLEGSVRVPAQSAEIQVDDRTLLLASRVIDSGGAVTTLLDITDVRRLEQVRRDFVANASHELKTPLTSIRGFAETLVDDDPPTEMRRQFLDAISSNALRLQRLVEDLLELSRLESGGWKATAEQVVVADAVGEAWDAVITGVDPVPSLEIEGDAVVLGDPEGLFQIFRNLLENSVRHTEAAGDIRVSVRSDGRGMASISVADDGEGIPTAALPRVFERFYRADSSRARDAGGTGLGLAIVKHLVVAMGGEIEAHSTPGFGTRMSFTVPLIHAGDDSDDLRPADAAP
jgi:two-component system, OmpR family, phosphate regulon sensor histidine kinase PhoR